MSNFFIEKTSVFISHKRLVGQASPEAVLIKNDIDSDSSYNAFMDVREDYLGKFPDTLTNKIVKSDVFILVLPNTKDMSFLKEESSWVRKEIKTVLSLCELKPGSVKILPVSFDKNFRWPEKSELTDIAAISEYNVFYYDTNLKESRQKLLDAIRVKRKYNMRNILMSAALAVLLCCLSMTLISRMFAPEPEYAYPESKEFMEHMEEQTSFVSFNEKEGDYSTKYFSWCLGQLNGGNNDVVLMNEFNECYIKGRCVRMVVLAYLAFTTGNLECEQSAKRVDELIAGAYDSIPEDFRVLFNYSGGYTVDRSNNFSNMIDSVFDYLDRQKDLAVLPDSFRKPLKEALTTRLWINN